MAPICKQEGVAMPVIELPERCDVLLFFCGNRTCFMREELSTNITRTAVGFGLGGSLATSSLA